MVPAAIVDPQVFAQGVPHDLFARLRRAGAVQWCAGGKFWAVFSHHEVRTVLRDGDTFSSSLGGTQLRDYAPDDLAYVQRQMLNMDGPEHSRIRSLLARAFTPQAVRRLEANIAARAATLVDAVIGAERFDFSSDLAADLPLFTLAEVLGVPESDRYLLYDWSNRVIGFQDPDYATSAAFDPSEATPMAQRAVALRPTPGADGAMPDPRSRHGMPDMYGYAHELATYKRAHRGDDVMSVLLALQDSGSGVSDEEFENLFFLFAVAGNETLRNGIPGGMVALLAHPDQYSALRGDPALVGSAVEEMLRWWPPVVHFRRTARRDVSLGGAQILTGDKVLVFHMAANRDETVFADPDVFDICRHPNEHVSFGFGPHHCLGATLARTQMRAMFTEVVTRLPVLEADGPMTRLVTSFQNGIKHLPVRWAGPAGAQG